MAHKTPNKQLLSFLRAKPCATAYKLDGEWTVTVFSGEGDEIASFDGLTQRQFKAKFSALCQLINIDDGGTEENPDYDPSLI